MSRFLIFVGGTALVFGQGCGAGGRGGGGGGGASAGGEGAGAGGDQGGGAQGVAGAAGDNQGLGGAATEECKKLNVALCDRLYECFTADQLEDLEQAGEFIDAVTCADAASDEACPDVAAAARGGTTTLHTDQTAACIADVGALACPDTLAEFLTTLGRQDSCQQMFVGTQDRGEPCKSGTECSAPTAECLGDTACTGPLGGDSFEKECSQPTADECEGLTCLTLKDNLQNATGICTLRCSGHWDCHEGARCYRLTEEDRVCLSDCTSDADCGGGFVCTAISEESKICFVEVAPG